MTVMTADEPDTKDNPIEAMLRRFGRRPDRHQMTIRLLGPVEVRGTWGEVRFVSRQERALLVLLALHLNEAVPEQRIIRALWGEDVPPSAPASCGSMISGLRLLLTSSGRGLQIEADRSGYRLIGDKSCVDVAVVRDLMKQARNAAAAGNAAKAISLLNNASAAWRGRALGDLADEDWASPYSIQLEDLRCQVLELRIETELECGRHVQAVPELQALVSAHPLREGFSAMLMLALFRSGRQEESLLVYSRLRNDLADLVAGEPSPGMQALHNQIATKDASLEWKAEAASSRVHPGAMQEDPRRSQGGRLKDPLTQQLRSVPALSGLNPRQLGRLARLIDMVDVSAGQILTQEGKFGQQAFIVLEGSAEVLIGGSLRRTVGPGEFVGEMAMIDRQPRSATVIAKTPMRLAVIGSSSWAAFMAEPGVSRAIAAQLVRRLRLADQMDPTIPSP